MGTDGDRKGTNCCLNTILGFLVLVAVLWGGFWWSIGSSVDDAEAEARAQVKGAAESARKRLAASAADDSLLGTEIARVLGRPLPGVDVRRQGRTVTVTAPFYGVGPGLLAGGTSVKGCYRFRVDPPDVSAREVPYDNCAKSPRVRFRPPEEVARDVVVELRPVVTRGGLDVVGNAEVWSTRGIELQDQETVEDRLTALVWMDGKTSADRYCYEFRVRAEPVSVTYKELPQQGCLRIERERQAREEAAARTRLDAAARDIERRLGRAAADGALTDAETAAALAVPGTGGPGEPAPGAWSAVRLGTTRTATDVTVRARVRSDNPIVWRDGCYEFRARLDTRSVTRRETGTDCLTS